MAAYQKDNGTLMWQGKKKKSGQKNIGVTKIAECWWNEEKEKWLKKENLRI